MYKQVHKGHSIISALLIVSSLWGCEEMIDVGSPRTELSSQVAFEDDLTATSAMAALYYQLSTNSVLDFTIPTSLTADDLIMEDGNEYSQIYRNELTSVNTRVEVIWRDAYRSIYQANAIIEGLVRSDKVAEKVKDQLIGEAKFFRAFYHFYLVNMFGRIPYATSSYYAANAALQRISVDDVYFRIISDLADARALLPEGYAHAGGERVRVNKWAAAALLARVYLYTGDNIRAEEQATRVIEQSGLYTLTMDPKDVFLRNSSEAILQLLPNHPLTYTMEGQGLNNPSDNAERPHISLGLFNAYETNDKRRANWIGIGTNETSTWYYALKYKEASFDTVGPNEYTTVLRLAEQYLIRAEARTRQGKLTGLNGAESDLNVIRSRAGLGTTSAITREQLLKVIEEERRRELFAEWGHRWFDLRRTGRIDEVLSAVKPSWSSTDAWYPIPFSELNLNRNLQPQNDGY